MKPVTINQALGSLGRSLVYLILEPLAVEVFRAIALYIAGRVILPELGLTPPSLWLWLVACVAWGLLMSVGNALADKIHKYGHEEEELREKTGVNDVLGSLK